MPARAGYSTGDKFIRVIDLYGELPCPLGDSSTQDTQCSPPYPGEPTGLS